VTISRIWVVMAKEVIDNIRDRRSITMAAIYPIIGPTLLGILLGFAQQMFRVDSATVERPPMELAVSGAEYAPDLVRFLEDNNVKVVLPPANISEAVRNSQTDLAIVVPEEFGSEFAAERPATVKVIINATRLGTVMAISKVIDVLRRYNQAVGKERLEARGLTAEFSQAIKIQSVNVGQSRSLAGFFLNMIPPFVIFTIFIGGVYLALDTTSGERERGSLEPLLTNPLARWEFMLGKVGAAFVFTLAAVIIQLIAFKVMFELVIEEDFGVRINPGVLVFAKILLISIPMMVLAVTIQIIVASITRSFKETQTYLGLLPLIPSIPGMVLVFVTVTAHLWLMSIPFFSQVVIIGQLVRGDPVSMANVVMSAGSTLLVAVGMLFIAGRLYSREQLLFTA
jgi:sodium transport system permease protein